MSVLHLTKENFEQEVLQAKEPVLVDFWASWCGPCQMVGPVVEEVAGEVTDAKICKVNVDEQPELARQFRVMSIPTLMVFMICFCFVKFIIPYFRNNSVIESHF